MLILLPTVDWNYVCLLGAKGFGPSLFIWLVKYKHTCSSIYFFNLNLARIEMEQELEDFWVPTLKDQINAWVERWRIKKIWDVAHDQQATSSLLPSGHRGVFKQHLFFLFFFFFFGFSVRGRRKIIVGLAQGLAVTDRYFCYQWEIKQSMPNLILRWNLLHSINQYLSTCQIWEREGTHFIVGMKEVPVAHYVK